MRNEQFRQPLNTYRTWEINRFPVPRGLREKKILATHSHCRQFYNHCFTPRSQYSLMAETEQYNEETLTQALVVRIWPAIFSKRLTYILIAFYETVRSSTIMDISVFTDTQQLQEITHCTLPATSLLFSILLLTVLLSELVGSPTPATKMEENANTSFEEDFEGQATHTGKETNCLFFFSKNKLNHPCSLGKPRIRVDPIGLPNPLHRNIGSKAKENVFWSDTPHGRAGNTKPTFAPILLLPDANSKCRRHLKKPLTAMARCSSCWFIASVVNSSLSSSG